MQQALDSHQVSCNPFRMPKPDMQHKSLAYRNDADFMSWYVFSMAPIHDWYLKEWLKTLGKRQADIVRDLDWNKAKVSLMIRGDQQYNRDAINELAAYLHLKPHEILMHPSDAMALRRLQSTAVEIAYASELLDSSDNLEPLKKVS